MIAIIQISTNVAKAKWLAMYGHTINSRIYSVNLQSSTIGEIIIKLQSLKCKGTIVKYHKHSILPEIIDF